MKYILMTRDRSPSCKEIIDVLTFHKVDYDLRIIGDPMQVEILKQKFSVETFPLFIKSTGEVIGGPAEILQLFPAPKPIEGDGPEILKISTVREGVKLPSYGSAESAGLDLCMHSVDFGNNVYPAYSLKSGFRCMFNTGLVIRVPKGFYGRVAPRSGLAVKYGIDVLAGVVDSDYRGELKVVLHNLGDRPVEFQTGDRIAQLIIEKISRPMIEFISREQIKNDKTVRGNEGFGSTGH
jgi:dUTP pyrophosphatase